MVDIKFLKKFVPWKLLGYDRFIDICFFHYVKINNTSTVGHYIEPSATPLLYYPLVKNSFMKQRFLCGILNVLLIVSYVREMRVAAKGDQCNLARQVSHCTLHVD